MTALATTARLTIAVLAAATLVASSKSKTADTQPQTPGAWNAAPPASAAMDLQAAVGLWKTTFGAVKIEDAGGGQVHGAWMYQREGKDVIGYFGGALDGNVLRLTWREPAQVQPGDTQLGGEGWLVFDAPNSRFSGRWWTNSHDRQGDWSGWRNPPAAVAPGLGGATYGGSMLGDANGDGIPDVQ